MIPENFKTDSTDKILRAAFQYEGSNNWVRVPLSGRSSRSVSSLVLNDSQVIAVRLTLAVEDPGFEYEEIIINRYRCREERAWRVFLYDIRRYKTEDDSRKRTNAITHLFLNDLI